MVRWNAVRLAVGAVLVGAASLVPAVGQAAQAGAATPQQAQQVAELDEDEGLSTMAALPNFFAVVSAAGALVHGSGVSGVSHPAVGQYEVTFTSNVSACAYVATTTNAFPQALTVFTAGGHLGPNGVYVETKNQGGGLTDGPFNLVVDCGTQGMQLAVVGYAANLVRSSPGAVLAPLGAGRYNVTFPITIKGCAFLATVGDPGNALVFNPAGVYTANGPNAQTVYVETKNPAGGLQAGVPFHLAVICKNAPNTRMAVVASSGMPVRASNLTSSFSSSTGNYAMVTNRSLVPCATVATRGSTNTQVPFTPATVEVTPGPAANTVGLQVRQLLFFGGAPLNEAFHVASVC